MQRLRDRLEMPQEIRAREKATAMSQPNPELEQVLRFVRLDGTPTAPVCFLTIEDGGNWKSARPPTTEDLKRYFKAGPDEAVPDNTLDTGKPGWVISKLMLALFSREHGSSALDNWGAYRRDLLYRRNECNIKFYPISRPNTGFWHQAIRDVVGLDAHQYVQLCRERRPELILRRYPAAFDGSQLHIILAASAEWRSVLDRHHEAQIVESDEGKAARWQLFTRGPSLAYAHFNIFRPYGVSDADILSFARCIRPFVPDAICARVTV